MKGRGPRKPKRKDGDRLRQYLAEITRDRVGRFVRIKALRSCDVPGCGLPTTEADKLLIEHADFLTELRKWLVGDAGTREDLAGVIDDFMAALKDDEPAVIEEAEANAHNGHKPHLWADVDPGELDVTGLDAPTARHLALLLKHWDHHGRVYTRDHGRRRLAGRLIRVDLANPFIQALGWPEHLADLAKEGAATLSFEDFDATDWNAAAAYHYGDRHAPAGSPA